MTEIRGGMSFDGRPSLGDQRRFVPSRPKTTGTLAGLSLLLPFTDQLLTCMRKQPCTTCQRPRKLYTCACRG